jgi:GntR family transcriptional regulator
LIQAGQIRTGDQLPTIRDLSEILAVNVNTVVLAYRDLSNEGVITTLRGKGTFITGTPSAEELQRIRVEKLRGMLETLLMETDRFGYTRDEVGRALVELFRRQL